MSVYEVAWVFRNSPYGEREQSVFLIHLALADVANDTHGHRLWMSREQIAQKARVSERTVTRAIQRLCDDGLLEQIEPPKRGQPPVYRMLFPKGAVVSPQRDSGDTSDRSGDTSDALGCHEAQPRLLLTQEELKDTNKATFATFWTTYPKRNGKRVGRAQAEAQWKKLSDAERGFALTAAAHYAAAVDSDLTIARDAFRWLRDKAFVDWMEPAVGKVKRKTLAELIEAADAEDARHLGTGVVEPRGRLAR